MGVAGCSRLVIASHAPGGKMANNGTTHLAGEWMCHPTSQIPEGPIGDILLSHVILIRRISVPVTASSLNMRTGEDGHSTPNSCTRNAALPVLFSF